MIGNWVVNSDNGLEWKNTETSQVVALLSVEEYKQRYGRKEPIILENEDADWIFTGQNSVIETINGSKQDAIGVVEEWLWNNPNPSPMIS